LQREFETYGRVVRIDLKRNKNYAFIQFENIEQATDAKKETDGMMLQGRQLTVEFVCRNNNERRKTSPEDGGGNAAGVQPPQQQRGREREVRRSRSRSSSPRRPIYNRRASPVYSRYSPPQGSTIVPSRR